MTSEPKTKTSLFPFDVDLETQMGPQKASVLKINNIGMIIEVQSPAFVTQTPVKAKWVMPMDNILLEEDCVIVKTYNQHRGEKIIYLIEIQYKRPKIKTIDGIAMFNMKIKTKIKKQTEKKDA